MPGRIWRPNCIIQNTIIGSGPHTKEVVQNFEETSDWEQKIWLHSQHWLLTWFVHIIMGWRGSTPSIEYSSPSEVQPNKLAASCKWHYSVLSHTRGEQLRKRSFTYTDPSSLLATTFAVGKAKAASTTTCTWTQSTCRSNSHSSLSHTSARQMLCNLVTELMSTLCELAHQAARATTDRREQYFGYALWE